MFHVKHAPSTAAILADAALSPTALEALERFSELLLRWNRTVNLVARRDEPLLWDRHIADSIQLIPWLGPRPERAIDIGSGAGFPGLVLAIATGISFDLIEADQRKAAFLREAARETGAPATIHAMRIDACKVSPAALVTARALAPLPALLELVVPKLAPGGIFLALKGRKAGSELTAAGTQWHMRVETLPSRTESGGSILRISEIARVDPSSNDQRPAASRDRDRQPEGRRR
jgi:16S rRNA (guanine527-N7)-methyltransferase